MTDIELLVGHALVQIEQGNRRIEASEAAVRAEWASSESTMRQEHAAAMQALRREHSAAVAALKAEQERTRALQQTLEALKARIIDTEQTAVEASKQAGKAVSLAVEAVETGLTQSKQDVATKLGNHAAEMKTMLAEQVEQHVARILPRPYAEAEETRRIQREFEARQREEQQRQEQQRKQEAEQRRVVEMRRREGRCQNCGAPADKLQPAQAGRKRCEECNHCHTQ